MAGKLYFLFALICVVPIIYACNEAICASVVSKCMLTQSCKCDLKDCSCCKDCFNCLSFLYSECCSCVDMCPKPNDTQTELSKSSYVEELADGVPGLFAALTSEPDQQQRWLSITYPVDIDLSAYRPASEKQLVYHLLTCCILWVYMAGDWQVRSTGRKLGRNMFLNCRGVGISRSSDYRGSPVQAEIPSPVFRAQGRWFSKQNRRQRKVIVDLIILESVEQESEPVSRDVVTLNCTVAYMSQCMSCDKCRASCRSMGANSLRWFHDGCCECVGDKCVYYGINESRCLACPGSKETAVNVVEEDLSYDDLDYGEDVDAQSV